MARKCLFCEREVKLSDEHVLPRWLLDYLEVRQDDLYMSHQSVFGYLVSKRGPMKFASFVNGCVCLDCNTGWMSQLECRVKPLLAPMMVLDLESLDRLQANAEVLSLWAVKTAAVLNSSTNYRRIVPDDHFRNVYAGLIPPHVYVNLGFTKDDRPIRFRQSQGHVAVSGVSHVPVITQAARHSYRITFQFKHLLVRVVYMPVAGLWLNDESLYLWPVCGKHPKFRTFQDIDDFDTSGYFSRVASQTP